MANKIKIFILQTLSASFSVMGAFIMQEKMTGSFRENIAQIFETNAVNSFLMAFTTLAGSLILHYLLNFGQSEILKLFHKIKQAQKEHEFILSKLEEAIIIKDTADQSISYSNRKGNRILTQLAQLNQDSSLDSLYLKAFTLQKIEKYNKTAGTTDLDEQGESSEHQETKFSLMDFFGMTKQDYQDKVFRISIDSYNTLEDVNEEKDNHRYVQIKRQEFKSDTKDYDMLKIVDVSMDILYQ